MAGNSIIFTDNLDEVLSAVDSAVTAGLVEIGATAQSYAKDITPVRTGTLRDSIGVEVKKDEKAAYIGTMAGRFPDKPYGKYVELGARGRPGVHMLQRAASEHTDEYKRIMEDAMKHA
ncbi:MAG: HK97 gp10 family phage protein [Rikenellaceae bacterium]|nr:HK97 gp10 family phage protein [Rikenellaceae bacterium]